MTERQYLKDFEKLLEEFENQWQTGVAPDIDSYVSGIAGDRRRTLLLDLIELDQEYRWKSLHECDVSTIQPVLLKDYVDRFPELGKVVELPESLIVQEFRARRRPPESIALAEFISKNNLHKAEIVKLLKATSSDSVREILELPGFDQIEPLGEGGMGLVYRARQIRMNRPVAIKVIPPTLHDDAQALKRFEREMLASAALNHPNVVTAYHADETDQTLYLVTELADGQDLSKYIKSEGPLSVHRAVSIILQVAQGLSHVHEHGVIHRDIKPGNLMYDQDHDRVRILDFGLAKFLDQAQVDSEFTSITRDLTSTGSVMGTVDYMAPEQATDTKSADERSDVYSLGCVFYCLLTGHPPYEGSSLMNRLLAHRDHPIPDLREVRIDVADELNAILAKMLAKSPDERFQTMEEVISAVELFQIPNLIDSIDSQLLSEDSNCSSHPENRLQESKPTHVELDATDAIQNETLLVNQVAVCDETMTGSQKPGKKIEYLRNRTQSIGKRHTWLMLFGGLIGAGLLLAIIIKIVSSDDSTVEIAQPSGETNVEVNQGGETDDNVQKVATPVPSTLPENEAERYGLVFDGVDDFVNTQRFRPDTSNPFTWEMTVSSPENPPRKIALLGGTGSTTLAHHPDGSVQFSIHSKAGLVSAKSPEQITLNQTHLAGCFDGRTLRLFVDGKLVETVPLRTSVENKGYSTSLAGIFNETLPPKIQFFKGSLREVRYSSIARHEADYEPIERFEPDAHTELLFHFDERRGDMAYDSSGYDRHAEITGATWILKPGSTSESIDDLERRIAEWAIRSGGFVRLKVFGDIKSANQLPDDAFHITHLDLSGQNISDLSGFGHLSKLPQLELITLKYSNVGSDVIPHIGECLNLWYLDITGTNIKSSSLSPLENARGLSSLAVSGDDSIDDSWGAISQISSLRTLVVKGSDVKLEPLADVSQLRHIWLPSRDSVDEQALNEFVRRNPLGRVIVGNGIGIPINVLGNATVRDLARSLHKIDAEMVFHEPNNSARLTYESLADTELFGIILINLPSNSRLSDDLRKRLTVADLTQLSAIGQQDADGLAEAIADQTRLASVNLQASDLTDAGLDSLVRLPHLEVLNVRGTRVSRDGVEKFRSARPDCTVYWNGPSGE